MSIQPVTKVSKMKDMLYIIIPKSIERKLSELGVDHGDFVVWKEPREEKGKVVITLEIVRTSNKVVKA